MTEAEKYARTLNLDEGWLCLDFANTAEWHASQKPIESLCSYGDLISWTLDKGLLTHEEGESLRDQGAQEPKVAADRLKQAITLRETIFRIFSAVAAGKSPAPVDLHTLSAMRAIGTAEFQIVAGRAGYVWDWRGITDAPQALLAPIVNSATDLLTSSDLRRVGQCADDRGCGWLFFDASRNRSRRWCSMEDCGNRAKARLHYSRRRTGKEPAKPE